MIQIENKYEIGQEVFYLSGNIMSQMVLDIRISILSTINLEQIITYKLLNLEEGGYIFIQECFLFKSIEDLLLHLKESYNKKREE